MNNEAIKKISQHYGYDAQSRQLIEEMAELTVALNKLWRTKQSAINANEEIVKRRFDAIFMKQKSETVEEMADVTIMLEQIKYLLSVSDTEIEQIIEQKLNRQLERIGADD